MTMVRYVLIGDNATLQKNAQNQSPNYFLDQKGRISLQNQWSNKPLRRDVSWDFFPSRNQYSGDISTMDITKRLDLIPIVKYEMRLFVHADNFLRQVKTGHGWIIAPTALRGCNYLFISEFWCRFSQSLLEKETQGIEYVQLCLRRLFLTDLTFFYNSGLIYWQSNIHNKPQLKKALQTDNITRAQNPKSCLLWETMHAQPLLGIKATVTRFRRRNDISGHFY